MAIQPAICSNCGGKINVDDINLNGFGECEFCKTPYKIIDVITVDGLPSLKNLLILAKIAVADNDYDKAMNFYNEALKIKSNCHEAWWGLYICNKYFDEFYQYTDIYGNSGPLVKASIMENTINKYAKMAIKFAPKTAAKQYSEFIQPDITFICSARMNSAKDTRSNYNNRCCIVTSVYGAYDNGEVAAIRNFRDISLSKNIVGRFIIKFYYQISKIFINHIRTNSYISFIIRSALNKFVKILKQINKDRYLFIESKSYKEVHKI